MMSPDERLHVAIVRRLAAQQAGEHLDAGERILDFVRHHRRHLADGGQPIAQALALFHLFDVGQVLEKERRAHRLAVLVAHQRQRVADHRIGGLQAQFRAVGERLQLERAAEDADDVGVLMEDVGIRGADDVVAGLEREQAAGFVVENDEAALAVDGQDAIAHVRHQMAEKCVLLSSLRVRVAWPSACCQGGIGKAHAPTQLRTQRSKSLRLQILDYDRGRWCITKL